MIVGTMSQPIIKIKDLSLIYNEGKQTEFKALKNINLEIFPEEFVIFFGPSGSGKSTLLYIIAGLESPTSGIVSVADKPNIANLSDKELIEYHRSSIGMIFQAFYLVPSLTAKDNVLLPMVFAGVDKEKRESAVSQLLERFGITTFQDRTPARLSGGQQQRVAIARSLINDPEIVLADEPVGNLDSKNADIVLDLINDLHTKDKKTVILVTHDPRHLKYANRIFYIKDGEITRVVQQKPETMTSVLKDTPPESIKKNKGTLLDRLALLYPQHDETRLKAKLLLNFILMPYDLETLDKVEEFVGEYLNGQLSQHELLKRLDTPPEEGGLALYSQTAKKIVFEVEKLAHEAELITKQAVHSEQIVGFLVKQHVGKISKDKRARLVEAVRLVMEEKLSVTELAQQIDKPVAEGGVGLNSRTAERFAEELEILLLKDKKA